MGVGWWGALYDESRRNKVLTGPDQAKMKGVVKINDWNDYVIRAEGKHIQLWINGFQTVDYTEQDPAVEPTGVIAVQIHGGPPSRGMVQGHRRPAWRAVTRRNDPSVMRAVAVGCVASPWSASFSPFRADSFLLSAPAFPPRRKRRCRPASMRSSSKVSALKRKYSSGAMADRVADVEVYLDAVRRPLKYDERLYAGRRTARPLATALQTLATGNERAEQLAQRADAVDDATAACAASIPGSTARRSPTS